MVQRRGGFRRKTRSKLKKPLNRKGKISIRAFFQSFKEGEKVCLVGEPAVQKGMFHPRFKGLAGTIVGKQGRCYEVKVKDGKKIRQQLEKAQLSKSFDKDLALILSTAFSELAMHKQSTRGKRAMMTCYDMTQMGVLLMNSREKALKQLELLKKAHKKGSISKETAAKARSVLALELELYRQVKATEQKKQARWQEQEKLVKQYKAGQIKASETFKQAADVILHMEGYKESK